ncbi:MAG: enoyl-CoA hydratase/isomerase family protein [Promethearchaeota archaeon]|nr:MAG: enoyl-CoA hydratase/isomerase family protein [Candidatus Lokiarchaeota archaeon]
MSEILYETKGRVGIITINRPEKANAVNIGMLQKIHAHLLEADENERVRCIVIRSVGDRFFSAGYDLKEVAGNPENVKLITDWGRKVNQTLLFLKKPVITQIQGAAIGFGVLLTVASDLTVFADRPQEELYLQLPELFISAFPQTGATLMPLMAFGIKYAKNLLFTNRKAGLEELKNMNFPTKIVPLEDLESETLAYAKQLGKLQMEFLFTAKSMMTIMNKAYITSCLDLEDECGAYAYSPKKSMKELHEFIQHLYDKYP